MALQVVNVSTGTAYWWGGDANFDLGLGHESSHRCDCPGKVGDPIVFTPEPSRDLRFLPMEFSKATYARDCRSTHGCREVVEDGLRLCVAGVTSVDGDIVFDGQYFDDRMLIEGWRKQVDMQQGPAYFAPSSALAVNYNTVCIVVSVPIGEPAVVRLEVPSDEISFDNQLTTVSKMSEVDSLLNESWMKRPVRSPTNQKAKCQKLDVGRYYRAVHNPVQFYISTFEQLMADQEIMSQGPLLLTAPDEAEVVVEKLISALAEVLNHMNKYSSTSMAEHVLKTIGAEIKGAHNDCKGLAVVADYLEEIVNLSNLSLPS